MRDPAATRLARPRSRSSSDGGRHGGEPRRRSRGARDLARARAANPARSSSARASARSRRGRGLAGVVAAAIAADPDAAEKVRAGNMKAVGRCRLRHAGDQGSRRRRRDQPPDPRAAGHLSAVYAGPLDAWPGHERNLVRRASVRARRWAHHVAHDLTTHNLEGACSWPRRPCRHRWCRRLDSGATDSRGSAPNTAEHGASQRHGPPRSDTGSLTE